MNGITQCGCIYWQCGRDRLTFPSKCLILINLILHVCMSALSSNWTGAFFYLHCDLRAGGGHADVLFIVKLFKLQASKWDSDCVVKSKCKEQSGKCVYLMNQRFPVSLPGQKAVHIISYKHLSKLAQHTLPSPTQGLCIYWHHTHSAFSMRQLTKGNYVEYWLLVIFNFLILVLLR